MPLKPLQVSEKYHLLLSFKLELWQLQKVPFKQFNPTIHSFQMPS